MNEKLAIYWDERVLLHRTGAALHEAKESPWLNMFQPHTEGPDRVRAMAQILRNGPVADYLSWQPGRLASKDELATVHPMEYINEIEKLSDAGGGWVTGTTVCGPGSFQPLLAAAGTSLAAAQAVVSGEFQQAYALVRPPGHHAQKQQADGYCFFNHVALAAQYARNEGIARVLIVDWDVHHGNGTQDVFYDRADVLSVSIHMNHGAWGPSHPQTGAPDEIGAAAGQGYNVNIPLPLGAGDQAYEQALVQVIEPIARAFQPGLIIAASGQDASAYDPNGRHNVTMHGYRTIGQRLAALAQELTGGKLLLIQEGGYNVSYAPYCLLATIEGVLDLPFEQHTADPLAYVPDQYLGVEQTLTEVKTAHAPFWPVTV